MNRKLIITRLPILAALTALLCSLTFAAYDPALDAGHSFQVEPWRGANPHHHYRQVKTNGVANSWDTYTLTPPATAEAHGVITNELYASGRHNYYIGQGWEDY